MSPGKFIVALTADFNDSSGAPKYRDTGLAVLAEQRHIGIALELERVKTRPALLALHLNLRARIA